MVVKRKTTVVLMLWLTKVSGIMQNTVMQQNEKNTTSKKLQHVVYYQKMTKSTMIDIMVTSQY